MNSVDSTDSRAARRATFGRVAGKYTEARPAYPDQLLGDLVRRCGIDSGTAVLEIGPGTGQLTMALAPLARCVQAIELSEDLLRLPVHGCPRSGTSKSLWLILILGPFPCVCSM
jgi:2-polyprenyl-3-methyl-5-hydroxy-6-metoxy-1,4-benzoquinol methylase